MQKNLSIQPRKGRSGGGIGELKKQGFLLIEAMIALTSSLIFFMIIMILRSQIALWHAHAHQYLQVVSIADRAMEHVLLKTSVPDKINNFQIKTDITKQKKIPFKRIKITVSWKSTRNQDKEYTIYGGMLDEA